MLTHTVEAELESIYRDSIHSTHFDYTFKYRIGVTPCAVYNTATFSLPKELAKKLSFNKPVKIVIHLKGDS